MNLTSVKNTDIIKIGRFIKYSDVCKETTLTNQKEILLAEYTMSDYPDKDLLEKLWKSGMRAKEIGQYLQDNGLPSVSHAALAKYGQRWWNKEAKKGKQAVENFKKISEIEEVVDTIKTSDIGDVSRISISKSGFAISVTPKSELDNIDEIAELPRFNSKAARKRSKKSKEENGPATHIIIPDTQIEPGRDWRHIIWAAQFINDHYHLTQNLKVIHLGDHWNMGSLSSYDKGKGAMEGRRYLADIASGNEAFEPLTRLPEQSENHFLMGNHDQARIDRAAESDIQLEGLITTDHMLTPGWIRHGFLDPVELDGISYSHYWYNPNTGKSYGDNVESRLKTLGRSFVQGHQQGLKFANRYINGIQQIGIIAGSFYLHEEDYMGPQGTGYWRGIVVLNNVENGQADPEFISIDQLCRMYEGISLSEYSSER